MRLKDELMQLRVSAFDDKQRVVKYEHEREEALLKAKELADQVTLMKREIDMLQGRAE